MTKKKDTALSLIRELVKMKCNGEIGCGRADGKHGRRCKEKCRACGDARIKLRARRYLKSRKPK